MSFRAVVVVGNEQGKVGVGVGKATDVINAVKKAVADGKKQVITVPLTGANSIPHATTGRFGALALFYDLRTRQWCNCRWSYSNCLGACWCKKYTIKTAWIK